MIGIRSLAVALRSAEALTAGGVEDSLIRQLHPTPAALQSI